MHGSTQKKTVRHKNAQFGTKIPLPSMCQLSLPLSNTPPPVWNIFFPIIFQYFVFKNQFTNTEMKMRNYIDMNSKLIYSISLWKFNCNHSFLFVMAIKSAAINKCYQYGRIFCQFLHFLLIFPLTSDTLVGRAQLIAGSTLHSTRTYVITVSNDRVSCRPHLEEKLRTLLPL